MADLSLFLASLRKRFTEGRLQLRAWCRKNVLSSENKPCTKEISTSFNNWTSHPKSTYERPNPGHENLQYVHVSVNTPAAKRWALVLCHQARTSVLTTWRCKLPTLFHITPLKSCVKCWNDLSAMFVPSEEHSVQPVRSRQPLLLGLAWIDTQSACFVFFSQRPSFLQHTKL